MSDAAQIDADDGADDFMAFCLKRNGILPPGVYTVRLVPKTARLLGKDDAFDYRNLSSDKVRGVEFRFEVVEAAGRDQIGRQFRYGFACDGPPTVSIIVGEDMDAIASWLEAVNAAKVPAGRLDILAQRLEEGSANKLLRIRITHRRGPRIRIERIKLAEAPE